MALGLPGDGKWWDEIKEDWGRQSTNIGMHSYQREMTRLNHFHKIWIFIQITSRIITILHQTFLYRVHSFCFHSPLETKPCILIRGMHFLRSEFPRGYSFSFIALAFMDISFFYRVRQTRLQSFSNALVKIRRELLLYTVLWGKCGIIEISRNL